MLKPTYIMVGGFLGAGKTTAILELAKRLRDRGLRIGLITNDQSSGLADTTILESSGFETEEITGGCFCCRFNTLVEASEKLTNSVSPEVFITEPVGSCTDLQATVAFPLRKIYGENYQIAPLSVIVDPHRAARVLGLDTGKTFSPKVLYIYEKQLEEAEMIIINKSDVVDVAQQDALQQKLEQRFPNATVLRMSARTGAGVDVWLNCLFDKVSAMSHTMEVDYDVYAEGEALLGWLNISLDVSGSEFDGNELLTRLGTNLHHRLNEAELEIAHLKMTLSPETGNDIAAGNLIRNRGRFELSHELAEPLDVGELIVNLRAEGDPQVLLSLVEAELQSTAAELNVELSATHQEAFRPGRPEPTYRMAQMTE